MTAPAPMPSDRLLTLLQNLATGPGVTPTAWPNLVAVRVTAPMARSPVVYAPCLCVVAQGRKLAYVGDDVFEYNAHSYLLCSLPLPIESEIREASPERPLIGMVLRFDPALIGRLVIEMDEVFQWPGESPSRPAVAGCEMTPAVHRAVIRLLEVVSDPLERRLLGPGAEREFLFEVLRGPNGSLLRDFVLRDGSAHRVARVVSFLEKNFREPLDITSIAKQAGMSASTLHQHFKRATSLSPIQFVKKMRLHEAHALLLSGRGASEAAFDVGYSSPSQFSREFRRMFGHAPSQVSAVA